MSWGRSLDGPPFVRGGLVATQAATMKARFGEWPATFLILVRRLYGGRIPDHVEELRRRLESARPWERCAHGVDLTTDRPFCAECFE